MGNQKFQDTCNWCRRSTSSIQSRGDVYLCPSCCPDISDDEKVPENAPHCWYNMGENERQDWRDGLSIEEIIQKYDWMSPPDRPNLSGQPSV